MSAFICNPEHIAELAKLFRKPDLGSYADSADDAAEMFAKQNIVSVQSRYPSIPAIDLIGMPPEDYIAECVKMSAEFAKVSEPVALIKMVQCYQYQSCEDSGWKASEAYQLCRVLMSYLIGKLPGYDEAPWEYSAEEGVA